MRTASGGPRREVVEGAMWFIVPKPRRCRGPPEAARRVAIPARWTASDRLDDEPHRLHRSSSPASGNGNPHGSGSPQLGIIAKIGSVAVTAAPLPVLLFICGIGGGAVKANDRALPGRGPNPALAGFAPKLIPIPEAF